MSSHPHPLPRQCCEMLHRCLFVSEIEIERGGGYLSPGERERERGEFTPREKVGNFHVSQQLLSMIEDIAWSNWALVYLAVVFV